MNQSKAGQHVLYNGTELLGKIFRNFYILKLRIYMIDKKIKIIDAIYYLMPIRNRTSRQKSKN